MPVNTGKNVIHFISTSAKIMLFSHVIILNRYYIAPRYEYTCTTFLLFYNNPKCPLFPLSSRLCVLCRTSTDRFLTCTGCSTGRLILNRITRRLGVRSVPAPVRPLPSPKTRKNQNHILIISIKTVKNQKKS